MIVQITEEVRKQAANVEPINDTIKIMLDDEAIYIDGTGETNVVSNEDKEATTTIITSQENFIKMAKGELNPMMAVMGGKVKIKGNMGLAMKLQSLI